MAWLDVYSCVLLMANPQVLPSFRRLERKSGLQFRKNTCPGKWELSAGFLWEVQHIAISVFTGCRGHMTAIHFPTVL